MSVAPLTRAALYTPTRQAALDFTNTNELSPIEGLIGQARAEEALGLALFVADAGYNVFVMGDVGMGKHAFARGILEAHARAGATPSDLCYVNNFAEPLAPRALTLPPTRGRTLRDEMRRLVDALRVAIRTAFESDDYRGRRHVLQHEVEQRHEQALELLQKEAREQNLAFLRTPMGFAFAPTSEGEILSPDAFSKLAEEQQAAVRKTMSEMEAKLAAVLSQLPRLQREAHERIRALDREVADFAVRPLFEDLVGRYRDLPSVTSWLDQVRADIGERADAFLVDETERANAALAAGLEDVRIERWAERRYAVNLLVDRSDTQGAPVVYEDHPTLENLMGRIEHRAQMGNLVTDFTLIQAGALHRANGGHLILDAQKLLSYPQSYEALKRALRSRQIRIESVAESLGFAPATRLNPAPVELSVKVTLLGDRELYYLLCAYDPEFDQLFKVAADFVDDVERSELNETSFARMIAGMLRREQLRAFDRAAVARVIEHAARLSGDAFRLTTQTQRLLDLLREAAYCCHKGGRDEVTRADVDAAIVAQERRADRVREDSLRLLRQGTLLLSTSGQLAGQVNALSVLSLGGFMFGRPSRVTCRVRIGRGELVDIEREVKLGGPLHSKGVLILSGFLGARYGRDRPLSLSASLVFEQSYGGIDGDSASLAEACALLSAIAEVPIAQRFAMTGSINQMGEVQPIGGVNEKIEGFFDACVAQGLSGEQAVIIPDSNVRHLMLRADVVDAVEQGKFAVYPVRHIDEALSLLTGLSVQAGDAQGLHQRIQERLDAFSERARELSAQHVEVRTQDVVTSKVPAPGLPGPGTDRTP